MKIKNKRTGFVFDIGEKEGKLLIEDDYETFEPVDKRLLPKTKKPKTVKEKVMGTECLKALKKTQIIQELNELSVTFNPKSTKTELVEILKKAGGF